MSIPPATDWARLYHAYGRAVDVPGQLAALSGADPAVRRAARSALTGSVHHQGTRWPASAHVVAPLVALVDTPATPERGTVLHVLHAVAVGDLTDGELPFDPLRAFAAADRVRPVDEDAVLRVLFEEEDPGIETVADVADAVALHWAAEAYRAAARHTASFLAWLRDRDPSVATRAAALLAWFPKTPGLASTLTDVPYDAHGPRASANLALAHLPGPPGSGELAALTACLASTDEAVRVTAAVALARRQSVALPDEALTVLVHADEGEVAGTVPGWDRSLRGHVAVALQRLGL
ncbi:hypothetical protein SGFS_005040 [Streptomyces graminofaciens]|uniref:HEAT repeat domain-containing protein n=1 Tax=Streptomyces graminofaciens TaxID=68212 RepID=A0ABM7F0R1_9ACTN|nr:hypothetical protein [Streptomyces graminofaciens]BBC29213.1 hypothetical protein SGFS_005040 [Streptomyces graminofaciens]